MCMHRLHHSSNSNWIDMTEKDRSILKKKSLADKRDSRILWSKDQCELSLIKCSLGSRWTISSWIIFGFVSSTVKGYTKPDSWGLCIEAVRGLSCTVLDVVWVISWKWLMFVVELTWNGTMLSIVMIVGCDRDAVNHTPFFSFVNACNNALPIHRIYMKNEFKLYKRKYIVMKLNHSPLLHRIRNPYL